MSEIIIRPAEPADDGLLRRGLIELQDSEKALHDARPAGVEMVEDYLPWLKEKLRDGGAVLIAEQNGVFTGFVTYYIDQGKNPADSKERYGYISDLCVMPEFRGQRIARMLLATAEQNLMKAGIGRIRIGRLAINEAAQKAYESVGYKPFYVAMEKAITVRVLEVGGAKGPEPTRYGDWEHKGRCTDF